MRKLPDKPDWAMGCQLRFIFGNGQVKPGVLDGARVALQKPTILMQLDIA